MEKGEGLGVTPEELNYVSHRRPRVSEMRKGRKGDAKEMAEEPREGSGLSKPHMWLESCPVTIQHPPSPQGKPRPSQLNLMARVCSCLETEQTSVWISEASRRV